MTIASSPAPDADDALARRVLVLAPTARDGEVTRTLLASAGIPVLVCEGLDDLVAEFDRGVGALLLTDRALALPDSHRLIAALDRQPDWSDVPVVTLVTGGVHSRQFQDALAKLSNATVLERPSPIRSVLSAVQAALRARQRQYENRDYIERIQRQQDALRASERTYRAIGESIAYGVWTADPGGSLTYVSPSFLELTGLSLEACRGDGWTRALHPDDLAGTLAAWRECVARGGNWYREHRMLGADGEYHPVLARGVPVRDDAGQVRAWAGINLDIAALKHVEAALQSADRRKDEFLAMLAHELRNPLAPIRNATELMARVAPADRRIAFAVGIIGRQLDQLTRLVDDLLDVSRITLGRVDLKLAPIEFGEVVAQAVEMVGPLLATKRHTCTVVPADEPLPVSGDAARLVQCLGNVLTNAAKYTDTGGSIRVALRRDGGDAVVEVADNGSGIAPELLPMVFDLFVQGDRTLDRSQGGLGIGLALVRRLLEMHGGRVGVRSGGAGQGTTVELRVPLSGEVRPQASPGRSEPSAPRRVLVVDDNADAADSLALVLGMEGHEAEPVHDSYAALRRAIDFRPDVVLLDIGLPELDGYEVARRLRDLPGLDGVRLIALTGYGQPEDRQRSQVAGFDDHLVKPVDFAALTQLIGAGRRAEPQASR